MPCKKMDTERSQCAEHITQTGHEINWKATERRAPYNDSTRKRKIGEALDILKGRNLTNAKAIPDICKHGHQNLGALLGETAVYVLLTP
ncbi:unnamed protein product [Protopolystoma xenopodis]|uniref:Uncharacterized protein n=1 Tax=Protopolystoma xenopodis TaxID=117903 RepID=A0A448WHG2_9PLAT|nr:unnamed protein product [Protopolystoma xenopodis]